MDEHPNVALLVSGPVAAVLGGAGAILVLLVFDAPFLVPALKGWAVATCLLTPVACDLVACRMMRRKPQPGG